MSDITTPVENTAQVSGEQSPKELTPTSSPDVKSSPTPPVDTSLATKSQRVRDEKGRYAKHPRLSQLNEVADDVLAKEPLKEEFKEPLKQSTFEVDPDLKPSLPLDGYITNKYKRIVQNADKPTSWANSMQETWTNLRNYALKGDGMISREDAAKLMENIYRREEQAQVGIETAFNKVSRYKQMFTPYLDEIHSNKLNEEDFFKALADTHISLKYAPLSQKIELYKEMGKLYGIPLDGSTIHNSNLPPHVEQELYNSQSQLRELNNQKYLQQEQTRDSIEQELYAMQSDSDNYPYFKEVVGKMTELAKVKSYPNLSDLYHEAVNLSSIHSSTSDTSKDDLILKLQNRLDHLEKQISGNSSKEALNKLAVKSTAPSQSVPEQNPRYQKPSRVNQRLELLKRGFNNI